MTSEPLPTHGMGGYAFEAFLGDLLKRMERIPRANPRLIGSARVGKTGQGQGGVDLRGEFSDGTRGAWQAKEQRALTAGNIKTIAGEMAEAGETAQKRYVVYSGVASPRVRAEIVKHDGWNLWDQEDLGDLVRSLLVQDARALLDTHFGSQFRRRFLPVAGTDVFLPLETYFAPLLDKTSRFHHAAPLAGRADNVAAIAEALIDTAGPRILIVAGPAGQGKTRLVLEALWQVERQVPAVPVLVRSAGHVLDSGALDELPASPAILLVEDVHNNLDELPAMLQYARRTDGARIVLTVRSFAEAAVEQTVIAAQFDTTDMRTLNLGPLTATAARRLVTDLQGDGLSLRPEFAEYLAQASRATPFIAVVATAMIRRGELSTSALTLDRNLQREVMNRYGQVTTDGIAGAPASEVRTLLAVVAALSPVSLRDLPLLDAIAEFLRTNRASLLSTIQTLAGHGALLERDEVIRVVPDLLADEILTGEAVRMGVDTGFAQRLWDAFSDRHGALLPNLAALDWRMQQSARIDGTTTAPDVFSTIWSGFSADFLAAESPLRWKMLQLLAVPAAAQSTRALTLLQQAITQPGPDPADGSGWITHRDVRHGCSGLVGTCVESDPGLASEGLDLLWDLARDDSRPINQEPDHPVRVMERLTSLGGGNALTTAQILIDRVTVWLQQPDDIHAIRTPLSTLEPLLAKDGYSQHWQLNAIGFRTFLVDPATYSPIREQVRALLRPILSGSDIGRAVDAVRLLGTALREPVGYFGQTVPIEKVLSWEDDDLRTLAALSAAADDTDESLIRCEIRAAVSWHFVSGTSAAVREASSALLAKLDTHREDVLTGLLVTRDHEAAYLIEPDVKRAANRGTQTDTDDPGDVVSRYEKAREQHQQDRMQVADQLWSANPDPQAVMATLGERLAVISAARIGNTPGLEPLLRAVAEARPGAAHELVGAVLGAPAGPLDSVLATLLDVVLVHDRDAFLDALRAAVAGRPSVMIGALHGFAWPGWRSVATDAAPVIAVAAEHADSGARQAALTSMGALLRSDPTGIAAQLRQAAAAHPHAVAAAVAIAVGTDSPQWVSSMTGDQRQAVLGLLAVLPDWDIWDYQLASAIAQHLPAEVIDVIAARAETGALRARHGWGLEQAFAGHPATLAAWITKGAPATGIQRMQWTSVWSVIAGVTPSEGAHVATSTIVRNGSTDELIFLADSLSECENFILDQPEIVTEIVESLPRHPEPARRHVRGTLIVSGAPLGTIRTPGQPARQNVENRDRAAALAEAAYLPQDVRDLYRELSAELQRQIDNDAEDDRREAED